MFLLVGGTIIVCVMIFFVLSLSLIGWLKIQYRKFRKANKKYGSYLPDVV